MYKLDNFLSYTLNTGRLKVKKNRHALMFNNKKKGKFSFKSAYLGLTNDENESFLIAKNKNLNLSRVFFEKNKFILNLFIYTKKLLEILNNLKKNKKLEFLIVCLIKKGLGVLKYLSFKNGFYYINYYIPQVLSNKKALKHDHQFVNGTNFYFTSGVFNKCALCYYLFCSPYDFMLIDLIKRKGLLIMSLTDNDIIINKSDYFYICNVYSVAAMYAAVILLYLF